MRKSAVKEIPQGYKNSPLGIIPNEWEVKRLGEISQMFSGGTPKSTEQMYFNGEIPFIKSGEINNAKTEQYLSELGLKNSSAKLIERGDLLYALYGATSGECALSKISGAINQAILCIRPTKDVDRYFLLSFLQKGKEYYYNSYLQGGQGNLSADIVKGYKILTPPLPEQRKIAEVLSTWDRAIEKQTLLVEKLELRKKGLMQQLLTGKKRLHGFNGKWEKEKLGKLFDERNETKMPSLPLLSITADKGVISQTASEKKDTSNEDKSKYKRICPGDIGYNTMRMWQGRCALSKLEGIVSPAYTIVSPHNDVNPFYMEMLFKQPFMVYRFWTHSQGLVNDTLNCKYPAFSQVKVTIPEIEEQNAIAEILSFCDKEIALAKQKLDTLRQQKKGLMQVLLTGKKRLK